MTNKDNSIASEKKVYKKKSLAKEALRRFAKNKLAVTALVIFIIIVLLAVFADKLAPYGEDEQNIAEKLMHPCAAHWLGTDNLGRDILSRLLYGARVSLKVGVYSVGVSAVLGTLMGASAGFFGGFVENIIMRFIEVMQSIPSTLLAIIMASALGPGINNCMIALGISIAPNFAKLVRSQVLSEAGKEYVEAEKAINASSGRIMFLHITPNVISTIIVQITMGFSGAILMAAGLSFIGLGAQAPQAEWGAMLSEGRAYIRDYGYLCTYPGIAIMITSFCLNIIGDAVRDALDPRLKN